MNKEARKDPRFPFVEQVTIITLKEESYIMHSENLCIGGIFLVTDTPLSPGTQGFIKMTVNINQEKKTISSKFRVIHNHPSKKGSRGMGIEFTDMSDESQSVLKELIGHIDK